MLRKLSSILAGLVVVILAGGIAWAANSTDVATTNLVDVDVATAGSLTLDVAEDLTITETRPAEGWTVEVEIPQGLEVEATFRNGSERVDFNAEFEDGQVRVRIRERASGSETVTFIDGGSGSTPTVPGDDTTVPTSVDDSSATTVTSEATTPDTTSSSVPGNDDGSTTTVPGQDDGSTSTTMPDHDDDDDDHSTSTTMPDHDDDDDDHSTSTTMPDHDDDDDSDSTTAFDGTYVYSVSGGSVSVTVTNGKLSLGSVTPASGWTYEVDKNQSDRIEVEFTNGDDDAEIEVRTDGGRLEVELDD